jgi:hypothetical protein
MPLNKHYAIRGTFLWVVVAIQGAWLPACTGEATTDRAPCTAIGGQPATNCCAPGTVDTEANCMSACRLAKDCHGYVAPGASSGAGNGGGGGAGGAGGVGGAGGEVLAPECVVDADCAQPVDAVCGVGKCIDGTCELEIWPGAIDSQLRGDCYRNDCDLNGKVMMLEDPGDVYDDGNLCTEDICVVNVATNKLRPDGSYCSELGSGYCYQGACVECIDSLQYTTCPGMVCDGFFYCVTAACAMNNVCGQTCKPCVYGAACTDNLDCLDGVCTNNMCAEPTCWDMVENDSETDVDCGGPCNAKCADALGCSAHSDCQSGVCWAGKCQAPTCKDGIMNGDEKGVDCGAGDCPACP